MGEQRGDRGKRRTEEVRMRKRAIGSSSQNIYNVC